MDNNKNLYNVTWLGESESHFNIELDDNEKQILEKFLKIAEDFVPAYDIPSITFEHV